MNRFFLCTLFLLTISACFALDVNIKQIDSLVTNPDIYRPDPVKELRITDSL